MKEVSKFYSSLGLLIMLNVIIKPVWIFAIDRQVQNTVGTAGYGSYFALLNFSIIFGFILDWGLTNFFNQQLAANPGNFINRAGPLLFLKLIFALLYTAIVCTAAWFSGVRSFTFLSCIILVQVLTSFFIFLRSILTAKQWFRTDAFFSVLDKGLMILVCGIFLYLPAVAGPFSLQKFLLIQIACTAIAIGILFFIVARRGVSFKLKKKYFPDRKLLRTALPFALIVLLMSLHYRLDAFLLERIHPNGAYEAGIYAGAYRLLDAANMVGYLLASFLLPFIARRWAQGKREDEVIVNSRHFLIVFSILIATTVFFLAPWIQQVLYYTKDEKAITVLQWCLPVLAGYALVQVYGTVMSATGNIVQFCAITFIAVMLNILLNLLLIPGNGAKGCCMAALLSQGFCGITTMLYLRQKHGINIRIRSLLMYIFIAASVSGLYYVAIKAGIREWMMITMAGILTITLAVALKLFDSRNWRSIIQQKEI